MSSVSAACIFDAYSASSAHTDTFYIVSQIVRVRNSKRHFFSKLTFRISFNHSASPYGNIDHSRSASPYGRIDHNRLAFALRQHRPQPPRFHPTATSTTTAPLHHTATSTITALPSPYGNIDHNHLASPYGHIDHSLSFRTTKPFEQLCRKFFVFF